MLYHGMPMSSTDTNIIVHTCDQELCVRPQHLRFRASAVALAVVLKALQQGGYQLIPPAGLQNSHRSSAVSNNNNNNNSTDKSKEVTDPLNMSHQQSTAITTSITTTITTTPSNPNSASSNTNNNSNTNPSAFAQLMTSSIAESQKVSSTAVGATAKSSNLIDLPVSSSSTIDLCDNKDELNSTTNRPVSVDSSGCISQNQETDDETEYSVEISGPFNIEQIQQYLQEDLKPCIQSLEKMVLSATDRSILCSHPEIDVSPTISLTNNTNNISTHPLVCNTNPPSNNNQGLASNISNNNSNNNNNNNNHHNTNPASNSTSNFDSPKTFIQHDYSSRYKPYHFQNYSKLMSHHHHHSHHKNRHSMKRMGSNISSVGDCKSPSSFKRGRMNEEKSKSKSPPVPLNITVSQHNFLKNAQAHHLGMGQKPSIPNTNPLLSPHQINGLNRHDPTTGMTNPLFHPFYPNPHNSNQLGPHPMNMCSPNSNNRYNMYHQHHNSNHAHKSQHPFHSHPHHPLVNPFIPTQNPNATNPNIPHSFSPFNFPTNVDISSNKIPHHLSSHLQTPNNNNPTPHIPTQGFSPLSSPRNAQQIDPQIPLSLTTNNTHSTSNNQKASNQIPTICRRQQQQPPLPTQHSYYPPNFPFRNNPFESIPPLGFSRFHSPKGKQTHPQQHHLQLPQHPQQIQQQFLQAQQQQHINQQQFNSIHRPIAEPAASLNQSNYPLQKLRYFPTNPNNNLPIGEEEDNLPQNLQEDLTNQNSTESFVKTPIEMDKTLSPCVTDDEFHNLTATSSLTTTVTTSTTSSNNQQTTSNINDNNPTTTPSNSTATTTTSSAASNNTSHDSKNYNNNNNNSSTPRKPVKKRLEARTPTYELSQEEQQSSSSLDFSASTGSAFRLVHKSKTPSTSASNVISIDTTSVPSISESIKADLGTDETELANILSDRSKLTSVSSDKIAGGGTASLNSSSSKLLGGSAIASSHHSTANNSSNATAATVAAVAASLFSKKMMSELSNQLLLQQKQRTNSTYNSSNSGGAGGGVHGLLSSTSQITPSNSALGAGPNSGCNCQDENCPSLNGYPGMNNCCSSSQASRTSVKSYSASGGNDGGGEMFVPFNFVFSGASRSTPITQTTPSDPKSSDNDSITNGTNHPSIHPSHSNNMPSSSNSYQHQASHFHSHHSHHHSNSNLSSSSSTYHQHQHHSSHNSNSRFPFNNRDARMPHHPTHHSNSSASSHHNTSNANGQAHMFLNAIRNSPMANNCSELLDLLSSMVQQYGIASGSNLNTPVDLGNTEHSRSESRILAHIYQRLCKGSPSDRGTNQWLQKNYSFSPLSTEMDIDYLRAAAAAHHARVKSRTSAAAMQQQISANNKARQQQLNNNNNNNNNNTTASSLPSKNTSTTIHHPQAQHPLHNYNLHTNSYNNDNKHNTTLEQNNNNNNNNNETNNNNKFNIKKSSPSPEIDVKSNSDSTPQNTTTKTAQSNGENNLDQSNDSNKSVVVSVE